MSVFSLRFEIFKFLDQVVLHESFFFQGRPEHVNLIVGLSQLFLVNFLFFLMQLNRLTVLIFNIIFGNFNLIDVFSDFLSFFFFLF